MIMNNLFKFILSVSLFILIPGLTSCDDSFIFEKEGNCDMKVKFVFEKHRQALQTIDGIGPDAFAKTVKSVHLFILDSRTGELVFEKAESSDNLIDRNTMPVELNPGTYTFIAWCGFDSNDENNAFELSHDYTRGEGDNCHIKMVSENEPFCQDKYDAVYQGIVYDVIITEKNMGGTIIVPVIKDTNDISVWIQHPDITFEEGDYNVVYEDSNGVLDFETNVVTSEDQKLAYRPYSSSILSVDSEYNGDNMQAGAMIAHLSTSRLLASHIGEARLKIIDKEGNEVFAIPFIKYLLEMQTFTNGREKDDQWYLDCEDTYFCSFYLIGDQGTWSAYRIIINNWVKVPDQVEEF